MVGMSRTLTLGDHISVSLRKVLQGGRRGKLGHTQVCNKGSRQAEHQRSAIRLRSLAFYVWECKSLGLLNSLLSYAPQIVIFVQSLSHVQFFVIPLTSGGQVSLSFTISLSLLKLMSIKSMMPSNLLILCCRLLLLPSIFLSIRVFSNESALQISWPKYWSFSISPSNEYSGLISFRIYWFDFLAVQGTHKSLLQHHSSKASILWHSAFFMVQIISTYDYWKNRSFDYMDLCQQSDVSAF